MKVKINELTWIGMDKLNQLTQERKELQQDETASLVDILMEQLEIYRLITDINSEYATGKQMEYEYKK